MVAVKDTWGRKHGKTSVGGQVRTFVDLLEADTGVPLDCLLAAMDDRAGWRKRVTEGLGMGADLGRPSSSSSSSSSSSRSRSSSSSSSSD